MSVSPTLVIAGMGIAKLILKLWLRDAQFAADILSDVSDIIGQKTADVFAQRQGSLQFENIGQKVAESLLPLFEAEGIGIDEAGQSAVAHAVRITLDEAQISAELLAKHNLEPTDLEKHILSSNPLTTQDLSESQTALYNRIITEVSQNIVDIASRLPAFTERTLAEVLKREDQLIVLTNEVLEEVRQIREVSQQQNPEVAAADFEIKYRRAIGRKLDKMELYGADVSVSSASRRYPLSVAYVTLLLKQQREESTNGEQRSRLGSQLDEAEYVTLPADEALSEQHYVILRGPAGSGKTTLLKWLAVRAATRTFKGTLADWNDKVPFFIPLRHYVTTNLPAPEDFTNAVASPISGLMPQGWAHNQLLLGRALVLIDGVDEIPESQRARVRDWLAELVGSFQNAQFVVTSRPLAVEEGWMEQEGFEDAELQSMDLLDIDTFIDHWHAAVEEVAVHTDEGFESEALAEKLKEELRQNRAVRNLATSPLLCAMLCAMHRETTGQIPRDRLQLYEESSKMLLERRDPQRGVDLRDYPQLRYAQKRALLADLAYYLLENGWTEVSRDRAEERLQYRLTTMHDLSQTVSSPDVLRLFLHRSGMVREPILGQIDFTHRTFQEYLAADQAVAEGDIGKLVSNAYDDQWREVIILAAGIARPDEVEELITGLISNGDAEEQYRHHMHLLAIACLETAVDLDPELRADLDRRLEALVPPGNITEAKAIASAGDLAVPYLAEWTEARAYATVTAACVRALAVIGTEDALTALENYATDNRWVVVMELLKAWDYFDRDEYERRILDKGRELSLKRHSSLEGIQRLTYLTKLELPNCYYVADLGPLAALKNLTSLNIDGGWRLSNLAPLAALENLTELGITGSTKVADLSILESLPNLESLTLNGHFAISNLRPITHLSNLKNLVLWGRFDTSDIDWLSELTGLTRLFLGGSGLKITDLSPLTKLTNLNQLILTGYHGVTDLGPLANLTSLNYLELRACYQVKDFSPLANLPNLTELVLRGYQLGSNLSSLQEQPNLNLILIESSPFH